MPRENSVTGKTVRLTGITGEGKFAKSLGLASADTQFYRLSHSLGNLPQKRPSSSAIAYPDIYRQHLRALICTHSADAKITRLVSLANTTFAASTILDQCPLTDVKSAFRHRFVSIVLGEVSEAQDNIGNIGLDVFNALCAQGSISERGSRSVWTDACNACKA